ncbi:MAG: molybdopterin-dependent oxidoreductase [Fervidicoccaceae archaeon]
MKNEQEKIKLTRRDFLKTAAFTALALSIPSGGLKLLESLTESEALSEQAPTSAQPLPAYIATSCGMCGGACGIKVGILNNEPVAAVPIEGHPQPGLCGRAAMLPWLYDNALRLKKPMKRVGNRGEGSFQEIPWDQALNEIASKLKEIVSKYGYKSIAITYHDCWSSYIPLFTYLFGTPNGISHVSTCHLAGSAARSQVLGIAGPNLVDPDYENASYLLLIGRSLSTGIMGHVQRARSNSKLRIVVVDPRMPEISFGNAEWIPIIPGTDPAFVLSLINVIIEEGLYDANFLKKYTNAPFLIKQDGKPLTEADVKQGGSSTTYMVYDSSSSSIVPYTSASQPDLNYQGNVTLADGSTASVKTAFLLLKDRASQYSPSNASKITGVDEDTIRRIAREFALYRGVADDTWYAAKNGNEYDAVKGILILNALVGNIDAMGGLVFQESAGIPSIITLVTSGGKTYAKTIYGASMPQEMFADSTQKRVDQLKYKLTLGTFDAVLDAILKDDPYPIRALFVIGTTPILRDMNASKVIEAYKKLDLVVFINVLYQDDADYADYILPDTTFLERDEIFATKWTPHAVVQMTRKVIEPPEDSDPREAVWAMFEIARRAFPERAYALGWKDEYADYSKFESQFVPSVIDAILNSVSSKWNVSKDRIKQELETNGFYLLKRKSYYSRPYKSPVGTPSGRVEIYPLAALASGLDPLPSYSPPAYTLPSAPNEFYLVNSKSPTTSLTATILEPSKFLEDRKVWMNPKDASRLGISDGDAIEIESIDLPGAKVIAEVRVTNRVREGVLYTRAQAGGRRAKKLVAMRHFSTNGVNPEFLAKVSLHPIIGYGATNCSVRIRKL